MKKSEFVSCVANTSGLTQKDCEKAIDAMCEVITNECVTNGGEVGLSIGKFRQKINKPKTGINPLTQKPMDVPESHTLAFKASKTVKVSVMPKTRQKTKK